MKSHLNLKPPTHTSRGGIGFTSLLLVVVGVTAIWVGSQLSSIYWDRWVLKQAVESVVADPCAGDITAQSLYESMTRRLAVQNIQLAREDFVMDVSTKPHAIKVYFHKDVKINDLLTVSGEEWIVQAVRSCEDAH